MSTLILIRLIGGILAGECGPLESECYLQVARTIANRIESPAFPDDLEDVLKAYYAYSAPTDSSLALAYLLVSAPDMLADGRMFYVYSDADRARMGWAAGDETVCGHGLCLHLSATWPGSRWASGNGRRGQRD